MKTPKLNLWSSRGVPHAEICARLAERSDAECVVALRTLCAHEGADIIDNLSAVACRERSTAKVLALIEPSIEEALAGNPARASLMELHALAVEAAVRAATRLIPGGGKRA